MGVIRRRVGNLLKVHCLRRIYWGWLWRLRDECFGVDELGVNGMGLHGCDEVRLGEMDLWITLEISKLLMYGEVDVMRD